MALEDLKSQLFKEDVDNRKINVLRKPTDLSQKKSLYKPGFSTETGVSSGYNAESLTLSSAIVAPQDNSSSNTSPVVVEPSATPTPTPTSTPTSTPTATPVPSYSIGDSALGGKIAYILQSGDPGYVGGEQHGLVATVSDTSTGASWGCQGTLISGADGIILGTGNQNTIDIMAGCATSTIAARRSGDLVEGGYSDWYLPSKDELNKLYINRVAIGNFASDDYWSSTEASDVNASIQSFVNGAQGTSNKSSFYYVRSVRSF
mgnify:CR=1 FL=1|jgi:hypothetical protein